MRLAQHFNADERLWAYCDLTAPSLPCPSASWMAASLPKPSLPPSFLARLPISKPAPSGSSILVFRRLSQVYHTHILPCSIFRPAKTATQSGDWNAHHWRMDWDVLSKGHRWENPLMGWQSSADYMQGTHLNFKSKDDAINFANKQGYEYFVQEPNERRIIPKAYANNFMHSPKKLKHIRTK